MVARWRLLSAVTRTGGQAPPSWEHIVKCDTGRARHGAQVWQSRIWGHDLAGFGAPHQRAIVPDAMIRHRC